MSVIIDQIAPDFKLKNQDSKEISLSNFKGKKILLYFYPKASTPGCTIQAQGIRDSIQELTKFNLIVLGVSPDTPKKQKNFIQKQNLNFDLLADENHHVAELYGVWQLKKFMGKEYMGIIRTSFLIDESGSINHIFNNFKTKEHHQIVLDYLNK